MAVSRKPCDVKLCRSMSERAQRPTAHMDSERAHHTTVAPALMKFTV